jgi:hypothetical protein
VNAALGRAVEAADAYDQYLKQGGSSVGAERRQEVRAELDRQLARIGTIAVHTSPEGADVRIDGKLVGKTPLAAPPRVNEGRHTVEAILVGYVPQARDVDVVGRSSAALELALVAAAPAAAPPVAAAAAAAATPAPPPEAPKEAAPPAAAPAGGERPVIGRIVIETPPSAPALESARAEPPAAAAAAGAAPAVGWQRIVGLLVTAGGIATITVGGIYAYRGANQAADANQRLAAATTGAQWDAAKPDFDAGKSLNQRGWTIAGVGAGVLVGGVIVIASTPERRSTVALAPLLAPRAGGLSVDCAW